MKHLGPDDEASFEQCSSVRMKHARNGVCDLYEKDEKRSWIQVLKSYFR